ncbi:MAG: DUF308 domain-containing protein [Candidatus Saccharimonadales bacterium]
MAKNNSLDYADSSYFVWQGAFSILLGVLVLVWPKLTFLTLVLLVSIWLLVLGVISLVQGITSIKKGGFQWLLLVALGIFQLGVGAYLVQRPGITALTLVTLLGLLFVLQGFVFVFRTFLGGNMDGGQRALSFIFGALSLIAGVWLWKYPLQGALAYVWLIGLYAIISGVIQIASAKELSEQSA